MEGGWGSGDCGEEERVGIPIGGMGRRSRSSGHSRWFSGWPGAMFTRIYSQHTVRSYAIETALVQAQLAASIVVECTLLFVSGSTSHILSATATALEWTLQFKAKIIIN